ncbi:MAG TPA: TRAP transporter large permease [bacterium]|nr:TRAP transporter large permease [bacterium]
MHIAFLAMIVVMMTLLVLGCPVGVSMIVAGFLYVLLAHLDPGFLTQQVVAGLFSNFLGLSIPLFIFSAKVMNSGSVTDRLLTFIEGLVGRFRGGLGHVNVVTNIIFAGMSGSGVADAAGVGVVLYRMMTKNGAYPPAFAVGLSAAASTIGPIIPPSIIMVLYAMVSDTSVGALFMAGIIPGLVMGLCLMVLVSVAARRRHFPTGASMRRAALARAFVKAILPLLTPAILLGGIYTGVFTPTEAAAVAAAYAILLTTIIYRDQKWAGLFATIVETAKDAAAVMVIYAGALAFNFVINLEQVPLAIAGWMNALQLSNQAFLVVTMVAFLVLGCFIDGNVLILVAFPLVLPAIQAHAINLVYFGVLACVNVQLGSVTPPYGIVLFILSSLTGTPLGDIIRNIWPFILALVVALFLMVLFPQIVTWLPHHFGLL